MLVRTAKRGKMYPMMRLWRRTVSRLQVLHMCPVLGKAEIFSLVNEP